MRKPRILVVDSTRTYQGMMNALALEVGAECVLADTLESGMVSLETGVFDLIVVAAVLSDGDGVEFARGCRTSPRHSGTPVLLVTADEPSSLAATAIPQGVTELIRRTDLELLGRHFADCAARWAAAADARVMVIDRGEHAAMPCAPVLRAAGLNVAHHSLEDGALRDLGSGTFDLVIIESALDDPTRGIEFLRAVRTAGSGAREVPILVMLADDDAAHRLECLRAGASDFLAPPLHPEDLVAHALTLIAGKRRDEQAAVASPTAPESALADDLTGVHSAQFLNQVAPMMLSAAARHGYPIALAVFDIDTLTQVNATHGKPVGDRVLAAVGKVIMSSCRREDIVARLEDDHFCAILPHCDLASALLKCERVRARIAALRTDGIGVTVSVGVSATPASGERRLPDLLDGAGLGLAAAKQHGRNRVVTESEARRRGAAELTRNAALLER